MTFSQFFARTRAIFVALAMLAGGTPAIAAPDDSLTFTGNGQVSIVEPVGIQPVADLRFGRIIRPTAAGTLVVDFNGVATETGGVTGNALSTPQLVNGRDAAAFAAFGDPDRFFFLRLPNQINVNNGNSTMRIDQFRANASNRRLLRFDRNGFLAIPVGARLNVNANQQVGSYTGTYDISIVYF